MTSSRFRLACNVALAAIATALLPDVVSAQTSTLTGWSFRVVPQSAANANAGRLEARPNASATWGSICKSDAPDAIANRVCASLGLPLADAALSVVPVGLRGAPAQPIYATSIDCSSAGGNQLGPCTIAAQDNTNCNHAQDTFVTCRWQYRLVDGSSQPVSSYDTYGRLEVRPNASASWGTACAQGFSTTPDASIACASAGFPTTSPILLTSGQFSSVASTTPSQPIFLTTPNCAGTESRLDLCNVGVPNSTCTHGTNDVVLFCSSSASTTTATTTTAAASAAATSTPTTAASSSNNTWAFRLVDSSGSTATTVGRLEARRNVGTKWGTVCDDGFTSVEAAVACTSVGLDPTSASWNTAPAALQGSDSQNIVLDDVSCTGSEANLGDCTWIGSARENCDHTEDVVVACGTGITAAPPTTAWEFRLVTATGALTNDTGRLEVRSTSTADWGTVCDDGFALNEATVACRSLGLSTVDPAWRSADATTLKGASTQPVAMDDVVCDVAAASLDQCSFVDNTQHNCGHVEDIVLTCNGGTTAAPSPDSTIVAATTTTGFEYRLITADGTAVNTSGRLEVRSDSTAEWATVCHTNFDPIDAFVACTTFGYDPTRLIAEAEQVTSTLFGSASSPVLMEDVSCFGTEPSIDRCSYATPGTGTSCAYWTATVLTCETFESAPTAAPATPSPPTTTLAPGVTATPSPPTTPAPPATTSLWRVRLNSGTNTSVGLLQVQTSATAAWGPICASNFDDFDAEVACRSLGFDMTVTETSFDTSLVFTEFASTSDPAVSDMACLGSEARIDLCPRAATTSCNVASDGLVVLRCIPSEFAYRLAGLGASTTHGRLETRPSQYKLWGTVCSDGFDVLDLKVACSSLGLTFDSTSYFRTITATESVDDDTTPIRLSGLLCDSTHERLDRCPLNASVSCTHDQDVYIGCGAAASVWEYRLADGPSSIGGRLETRPNSSSSWGTICSLNFADADAFVACRALGFDLQSTVVTHTTAATTTAGIASDASPVWLPGVLSCTGTEARPELCSFAERTTCASHVRDVYLTCTPQPLDSTYEYGIEAGADSGRLLVRSSSDAEWGTVCDDRFAQSAAEVACRSIHGTTTANNMAASYRTVESSEASSAVVYPNGTKGTSTAPIAFSSITCTGTEAAIDGCTVVLSSGVCSHTEDVYLSCRSVTTPSSPASYEYRLQDLQRNGRGRLEVRPTANDSWGGVCATGFSSNDALVACRSVGLTTTAPQVYHIPASSTTLAVSYMESVRCFRSQSLLSDCSFVVPGEGTCTSLVGVDCGLSAFQFRLLPEGTDSASTTGLVAGATAGDLQARPTASDPWQRVCYGKMTQAAATAACRTIVGTTHTSATFTSFDLHDDTNQSVPVVTDLSCIGTSLDTLNNGACTFTSPKTSRCLGVRLTCNSTVASSAISSGTVSIASGTSGIVSLTPANKFAPSGTICSAGVTSAVAGLLCTASGVAVTNAGVSSATTDGSLGPIYATSLVCPSGAVSLSQCTYSLLTGSCTNDQLLAVDCTLEATEYRLSASTNPNAGRLEVKLSGSASFGTVCAGTSGLTPSDLEVMCVSLGYPSGTIGARVPSYALSEASSDTPIAVSREFSCTGAEVSLVFCPDKEVTTNQTCTHSNDVVIACGGDTVESGCTGSDDCSLWVFAGSNVQPPCAATATINAANGDSVSHATCRKEATFAAGSDGTASYVVNTDDSACEVFGCSFTALSLVANPSSSTTGSGNRMYAPIKSTLASLGFCSRDVSCNSHGDASKSRSSYLLQCDRATSGAACVVNAANTTTGLKKSYDQVCTCVCDEGFTGSDCSVVSSMSSPAQTFTVAYTHPTSSLSDVQLLSIADEIKNSLITDTTVSLSASHGVAYAGYYTAVITVSATVTSEAQATVTTLLSSANSDVVETIIENTQTSLEVLDIATTSAALRPQLTSTVTVDATGNSHSIVMPAFESMTGSYVAGLATSVDRVVLSITGGARVAAAAISLRSNDIEVAMCEPSSQPDTSGCDALHQCTVDVPSIAMSSVPTISVVGIEPNCTTTTSRRQTTTSMNVSVRAVAKQSMPDHEMSRNDQVDPTSTFTTEGIILAILISVLVLFLLASLAAAARAFHRGHRFLPLVLFAAAIGWGAFFFTAGVVSVVELGTEKTATADLMIEEFTSEECASSNTSTLPYRAGWISADSVCRKFTVYGTRETTYWGAAHCAPIGATGYDPTAITIATGPTEAECIANWQSSQSSVKSSACEKESNLMSTKMATTLHFTRTFCMTPAKRAIREVFFEDYLDPQSSPKESKSTTTLPAADRMFRSGRSSSIWFFIGAWRSFASYFIFNTGDSVSSPALASFSVEDMLNGQVGTSTQTVTYGTDLPPDFSRNDGNSTSVDAAMAPIGPLFNLGTTVSTTSQYGANAMRYHGIRNTVLDLGALDPDRGFTITWWMRAATDTSGFVFMALDGWVGDDGSSPIAERLISVIENPARSFFREDWTAYSGIYVDGSLSQVRFVFRTAVNKGAAFEDMSWGSDVLGNLFDDTWHFLALTYSVSGDRGRVQIMVDGVTSYTDTSYTQCLGDGSTFPAVSQLPTTVKVSNTRTQEAFDDGVAYIGYLNGGIFGFQVHDSTLSRRVTVKLGATSMHSSASVDVDNSRIAAGVLLGVAALTFVISILQWILVKTQDARDVIVIADAASHGINYDRETQNVDTVIGGTTNNDLVTNADDTATGDAAAGGAETTAGGRPGTSHATKPEVSTVRADAMTNATGGATTTSNNTGTTTQAPAAESTTTSAAPNSGSAAAQTSKVSVSSLSLGKSLAVIVPMFVSVAQNMTLYFETWTWPLSFSDVFGWIYFPFSLDFFAIPSIPFYVTYIVQFGLAIFALAFVVWLSRGDHDAFRERVLEYAEVHGLLSDVVQTQEGKKLVESRGGHDGLPNPDTTHPLSDVSVLEFKVGGNFVVGITSRACLQNAVLDRLMRPDAADPEYNFDDPQENTGKFVAVMLSSDATPGTFATVKNKRRIVSDELPDVATDLAALPGTIEEKLSLCGLDRILDVPSPDRSLLQVYRSLEAEYPSLSQSPAALSTPAGLWSVIHAAQTHYALAAVMGSMVPTIVAKLLTLRRVKLIASARHHAISRGGTPDEVAARVKRVMEHLTTHDFIRDFFSSLPEGMGVDHLRDVRFRSVTKQDESDASIAIEPSMQVESVLGDEPSVGQLTAWGTGDAEPTSTRANQAEDRTVSFHPDVADSNAPGSTGAPVGSSAFSELSVTNSALSGPAIGSVLRRGYTASEIHAALSYVGRQEAHDMPLEWLATMEKRLGKDNPFDLGVTPFSIARDAGIHVDDPESDTAASDVLERDTAVLARCLRVHGGEAHLYAVQALYFLLNPRFLTTVDDAEIEIAMRHADSDPEHPGFIPPLSEDEHQSVAENAERLFDRAINALHRPIRRSELLLESASVQLGHVKLQPLTGTLRSPWQQGTCIKDAKEEPAAVPVFCALDLNSFKRREGEPFAGNGDQPTAASPTVVAEHLVVPQRQFPYCPLHATRLFPAVDDAHLPVRERNLAAYPCAHRHNTVFRRYCLTEEQRNDTCDIDFFVCPVDTCNFSVCERCIGLSKMNSVKAIIAQQAYVLQSANLLSFVGLVVIVIAQALYLPVMKSAVSTVFCHTSLQCHFPSCYTPATSDFLATSIVSAFMIVTLGVGLVWFLFTSLFRRKRAIMQSSALDGHLTYKTCGEEQPHYYGSSGIADTLFVGASDTAYLKLLTRDYSMFKGLYEQYEMRWMFVHPVTFLFKVAILLVVLYSGEPDSLRLIVYSSVVEIVQLVYFVITAPFINSWLDFLAKAGSLHQVTQLGLMCIYRADTFEDPNSTSTTWWMVGFSIVYMLLVIVVIAKVAVLPVVAALRAKAAKRSDERRKFKERMAHQHVEDTSAAEENRFARTALGRVAAGGFK